jgi:hypothetical protein
MGAVFVRGSFAADGVGSHFCRAACGRRRSLLGRAWLLAGQEPGIGATRRERQHCGPVEGLQERGSRRSGECGAKGGQRHLGDRGACRRVPAQPVADAAASSRLWGPFRQDFGGYGRQNPTEPASFFGNFLSVCDLRARFQVTALRKSEPGGPHGMARHGGRR